MPVAVACWATLGALPFVRMTGGDWWGGDFPQDESSAVSELDFVAGRVAQVTVGEASSGNPAEARTWWTSTASRITSGSNR
ncbi:hypothetical protein ACU4GD_19735 [Cupriavidus basilensis]